MSLLSHVIATAAPRDLLAVGFVLGALASQVVGLAVDVIRSVRRAG